ncbi:prohibitin family protein [Ruminococcus sp. NK3A76]|uniref:prohibitin family protein n=1 Tax=Ruminococcus sp. NK3A76 TaxID=877411 RepID=UPI0006911856|nr:prohibitin family protein [Ruminococcus sp. NK3A76]
MNGNVVDIKDRSKKTGRIVGGIAVAIAAIIVVASSAAVVPTGSTGVITTFGKVSEDTYSEGFHLKIPLAQDMVIISNKIQVYETDASAVSKDLQTVNSKIAINYRVKADSSASIYKNIGPDYESVILTPAAQESMKSVTARYTAEHLITQRNTVGEEIKEMLETKVSEYGIQIEKFNIINFDFSAEFNAAIEQKQVAEQNKLRSETEKEQKIIEAQADAEKVKLAAEAQAESIKTKAAAQAEANKTIAESLSPELIQYQTIDKWDGVMPKVASSASPLLMIDVDEQEQQSSDK